MQAKAVINRSHIYQFPQLSCIEVWRGKRRMGMLDSIENLVGQGSEANSKVAGGLMQSLEEHPGGLSGIIDQFRNNGMSGHVQGWAAGQPTPATPDQIQQGMGNTGFIDRVAAKAGVSPEVAKIGLGIMLPIVISHFHSGGQTVPQSGFGGMASQVLGKFL